MYEQFTSDSELFLYDVRLITVPVVHIISLYVVNQAPRLSRSPNIITHARGGRTTAGP
jgi:hypothetical protein